MRALALLGLFALGCSSASAGGGSDGGPPQDASTDTSRTTDAAGGDSSRAKDGSGGQDSPTQADSKSDAPPGTDASAFSEAGAILGLDGTTYYVSDTTGDDANPGTAAAPWKTIQHAGGIVGPGDTVLVRAGTYDGAIFGWDTAPCSGDPLCTVAGNAAHPVLFEADPAAAAGSVVIAARNGENAVGFDLEPGCDYVDVLGFTVTNGGTAKNPSGGITKAGIEVAGSKGNKVLYNTVDGVSGVGGILVDTVHSVVVLGNTLIDTKGTGTTGHGLYVSGSSVGVQVLANFIHDNDYVGIHVNGDVSEGLPGVVTGCLFAGNLIYGNGQNGINADGLESSTIENNVIYGNARHGIELYEIDAYGGSTGNVIVNNTIDQSMSSGSYAISIDACAYDNQGSQPTPPGCMTASADTSTGNVAFDNVLLGKSGAVTDVSSADLSTSTNITTAMSGLFVDPSAGDYTLTPGGPGVGAGVGSFGGASAPAAAPGKYDIGAFAFAH